MTTDSKTVAFIYLLLMGVLPVSAVEDLLHGVDALEGPDDGYDLPNENIAECAHELAAWLKF